MRPRIFIILGLLALAAPSDPPASENLVFWNRTGTAITKLFLAAPGTSKWGPDQCAKHKDGRVDEDQHLDLTGLTADRYDVKLTDVSGRTCVIKDVVLQTGRAYAFSLSEPDLKDCSK
jgi:hypothetical protein